MGLRAGIHGTVGQSSAQVIDGSLQFDKDGNYLNNSNSSGNRNNWTISCWIKRPKIGDRQTKESFDSGATAIRFGDDVFQSWIDGASGNNGENTPTAIFQR